jgi:trans-2,3-dihydro-3-hydroxyanthranilate isomerase
MFALRLGVTEDPATGSAAAAFAGLCAQTLSLADGQHRFLIEQGYEMGRPSLIELQLTIGGGKLATASIGGQAIVVTEGTIEV